jgi:hypothetical protein
VHQVGNFSFLTLKAKAVGEVQILRTATVRDRRIFFNRLNHVIYSEKVLQNKNEQKKIIHFSRH